MQMTPVVSSNIHSIGYENSTLYVRFHSGSLYAYYHVPESIYIGLMNAPSHGHFLHKHVKGHFSYKRLY